MAPLLVVVILSVLVLPIAGVQVGNNTSRWLTEANYLSKAKGFGPAIQGSLTVRRPLLPLMIAAAFKIGGKSVHSAVVLVRIFFAFELVLIYLIGRVFYNAAAGCGWAICFSIKARSAAFSHLPMRPRRIELLERGGLSQNGHTYSPRALGNPCRGITRSFYLKSPRCLCF